MRLHLLHAPTTMIGVRLAVALLIVSSLRAGELRVDINRDSKNSPSVTETNYVQWSTDSTNAAATGTAAVSRSFTTSTGENVTVTFAQTAASATAGGTGLLSNWYQTGAQGTAKLVSDGLTVAPPCSSSPPTRRPVAQPSRSATP
jgi:hypothetical protein